MNNDLKLCYDQLVRSAKQSRVFNAYYDGKQPLIYTHERLKEVFGKSTVEFIQNWCCVVIDSVLDRIIFKGWDAESDSINAQMDAYYDALKIQKISRLVHKDAIITGDGYVVFDLIDGIKKPYYNPADMMTVIYESDDPEKKKVAAKKWRDNEQNVTKLNLYYDTFIEKYSAEKETNSKSFELVEVIPNAFGKIPVVHFQTNSLELANVIPIQNSINKTFSDMMVVAEFGAFPQRWAVTNANLDSLTSDPASIMGIPKGTSDEEGTQIGQFASANLDMYLGAMDKLANTIAIISRTPKHYFMTTGANIAGEALMVMESPLVKKCQQYEENFSDGWIEVGQYLMDSEDLMCVWETLETELIETKARAMKTYKDMGFPRKTICRRFGWSTDEIAQMELDEAEEKEANAEMASLALETARMKMMADNNVGSNNEPVL